MKKKDIDTLFDILIKSESIRFGSFTTKSGRKSPYFINLGHVSQGEHLTLLGKLYAKTIHKNFSDASCLLGPPYKGIILTPLISSFLSMQYKKTIAFTSFRKESKSHGEKGKILGHLPQKNDKIIICDDVITSGMSIDESINFLNNLTHPPQIIGIITAIDRQEKDKNGNNPIKKYQEIGIKVKSIINITNIIDYVKNNQLLTDKKILIQINTYRKTYGL